MSLGSKGKKVFKLKLKDMFVQQVAFYELIHPQREHIAQKLTRDEQIFDLFERQLFAFVDAQVYALYGKELFGASTLLSKAKVIALPAGEKAKSMTVLKGILSTLKKAQAGRDKSTVIAVGGGACLDVVSLASSLFHRGLPLIHVPTTLLAMVDATIGGKTSVNAFGVKNIVGTFYPPRLSLIDHYFLCTLADRFLREGLVEALKTGFLDNRAVFNKMLSLAEATLHGNFQAAKELVEKVIKIKARFVSGDFRDLSARRALNLGHTVGHAIEAVSSYRVRHGMAVAKGIIVESAISIGLGMTSAHKVIELVKSMSIIGGVTIRRKDGIDYAGRLWEKIVYEKKGRRLPAFVLPIEPGKVVVEEVRKRDFIRISANLFDKGLSW